MRLLFAFLFLSSSLSAQLITGAYDFQDDPAKKYALYIPSTYNETIPSKVIVGLHPWNTSKWDAESWAEELSELAELNNTILICPDGGEDGQIDDDIDTSFTTFLIDQVAMNYNLSLDSMYLVGFSWGARTVYTYGLTHKTKFAGFMPIGAAVELPVVEDLIQDVEQLPFYIIHGNLDNPGVRFYPIRDALQEAGACVETNLLSLVGHTIDFPDQLNILNTGFQWLLDNNCSATSSLIEVEVPVLLSKHVFTQGEFLQFQSFQKETFEVFNLSGQGVLKGAAEGINLDFPAGSYVIHIENNKAYHIIIR